MLAGDHDVTGLTASERPVGAFVLDHGNGQILAAERDRLGKKLGEARIKRLLRFGAAAGRQSHLDEHETIRPVYVEIRAIELKAVRLVLADDLEAISLGNVECLRHRALEAIANRLALIKLIR